VIIILLFPKQKADTCNNKGMSVAIASVILISVAIASTLAVSGWIGAFSVDLMETEALWVSDILYQGTSGASDKQIMLTVKNTGSYSLVVIEVKIIGGTLDLTINNLVVSINDAESQTITLENVGWVKGSNYQFDLRTSRQNTFVTTDVV